MAMEHREYRIRSQSYRYKQLSIPNESELKVGDTVKLIFEDSLVLVVPVDWIVDERKLAKAVNSNPKV